MKKVHVSTMSVFLALSLLLPLSAGAQGILGLEGPITNVRPVNRVIVVMGIPVSVPPGTPIVSPTANLTELAGAGNPLRQLLGNPLPGRIEPGFLGGTAIINGTIIGGVPTATDVFVEPSENVLIGTISAAVCTNATCTGVGDSLSVLGSPVLPIRDQRLPAGPVTNDFGFEADLTGAGAAILGSAVAAEGYFARGRFRYFLMEIAGAPLANPGVREVNITRAQCRDEGPNINMNILGNVHNPATGPVTISDTNTGTPFPGVGTAVAAGGGFGTYDYRLDGNPAFATCPTSVTATFQGQGAGIVVTATADVDIIP